MTGKISNIDVLDGFSMIASNSVDLIIADPPYGIAKNFGLKDSYNNIDEWKEWCLLWLTESKRVMKDSGSILLYGIHNYICFNHVQMHELGLQYRRQIIWHYENGFCGNRAMRATYEPLLWFSKTKDFFFEEIREPYKSAERLKYAVNKNGKVWQPNPKGRLAGDVWAIPTLAGRRYADERVDHPTQKPLMLSERIVQHFCPENGNILIPFAGSGSECLAAFRLQRNFTGFEINPSYCELGEARLRAEGWRPAKQTSRKAVRSNSKQSRIVVSA